MKVDFSKSTPSSPVVDVASTVTPVSAPETASPVSVPATVSAPRSDDFLSDTIPGLGDIQLPRLNLVQFSGELKDTFNPGEIIFGQNLVLFTPQVVNKQTGNIEKPAAPPVNITIIGWRPTRFIEKVPGGSGGQIVNSEAEVRTAGGTLDYQEFKLKEKSGMKRFGPLMEAFVAIRRPEHVADDDSVFTFDVDGAKYTFALWSLKFTSYTTAFKQVLGPARSMGCLKKTGYPGWNYNLTTRLEKKFDNSYFVPVLIPNKANTPAFLEFVRAIRSAPTVAGSEE